MFRGKPRATMYLVALSFNVVDWLDEDEPLLRHPELIAGMLFLHAMEENEAIDIVGVERWKKITFLHGYCLIKDYITRPLDTNYDRIDALAVVKYCSENNKRFIHFSTCEVYGNRLDAFSPKIVLLVSANPIATPQIKLPQNIA
ncbi:UDP-D-apiose UDP-D-xylose synthase [Stylosanthes scabra]|uniref:UDP-D-apiose UDP-D-xylose synthase n=1 Tax=Stylosanthes scabra TaxID=79078 RepID=A0ABU6W6M5_9FABA|nr:UDP-D-apiose UDP-D-xylose synthase [Stylosanthes scabra]